MNIFIIQRNGTVYPTAFTSLKAACVAADISYSTASKMSSEGPLVSYSFLEYRVQGKHVFQEVVTITPAIVERINGRGRNIITQ